MSEISDSSRPGTVTISFFLWLATVVLGIVGSVVVLAVSGSASNDSSIAGESAIYFTSAIVAIVLSVIQLVVVFKMRAGRNWARITLLVLALLQAISAVSQGVSGSGFTWLGLLTVTVATVLMFLPSSNSFFLRKADAGA